MWSPGLQMPLMIRFRDSVTPLLKQTLSGVLRLTRRAMFCLRLYIFSKMGYSEAPLVRLMLVQERSRKSRISSAMSGALGKLVAALSRYMRLFCVMIFSFCAKCCE